MNILEADIDIMARTVYGEARGEDYPGKLAVAHVIKNRWLTNKGQFARDDTIATACLRHRQYSAWNKGDPNFKAMFAVLPNDPIFMSCKQAALEALAAIEDQVTFGSTHYHTNAVEPDWAKDKIPAVAIGLHKFYNNVD